MTGSWRLVGEESLEKHDHVSVELSDGRRLVFRDPRRFGMIDFVAKANEESHPRLKGLGVEPLDVNTSGDIKRIDSWINDTRER